MNIFGTYARYYNLLYRDKDYAGEVQFVDGLLQNHAPTTKSILELGCGTGNHALLLARAGYEVHGVDLSAEMLQQASDRLSILPTDTASRLGFSVGDIRTIHLNQQFDAVISLFHVISYQTTNEDLEAAFATVKAHLKPGGVFIFDCWYGPAVLSDRPNIRVKRLEDEEIQITRIAEPVIYPNDNLVDVNYQIFIKDKNSGAVSDFHETHMMRYLFKPEIDLFFAKFKIKLLGYGELVTNRHPGFDTWGIYLVGKNQ
ncbi:class I SAM-dependent methyltransferase [Calothrix sp. PCC 7507]|uniref:class I SAM-dependent DNA methyltransferase n=1 Tax=Calothrix sp. PCC 7507 TaxID=99598 RepID=UPI00029F115C|nr:class I SAM-dependent methyltransferase [Calothrix sp. PCC 7507]AFY34232.1 Methyltransferase type 11 [Calothrix sp. PCC 7507]